YWTLPQSSGFDVADLTTIAYFSLGVNGDGSIQATGPGWNGYQSQDLANLITRAHAAGSRVVLTLTCFGQNALNQLTSDPTTPNRLATNLIPLLTAKNLDGVNFDFEGEGNGDQTGLDALVAQVSSAVRAADSHWQVTMDTYASSAGDPGGFYDIAGLAPSVDAFFVMAYDMNGTTPSPTAALTGSGFTDLDALQEYTAVVPASKVILGVPYYGYDWPTTGPGLGATATGTKTPMSYGQIAAAGHPVYWDPATQTAWTSYQVGTQWHQTWFDDPTSLALKAQLAASFHVAGMGVWALGMDGNDPAMMAALLGNAPVVKDYLPGPSPTNAAADGSTTTTSTTDAATAYSYSGVWNEGAVALSPATSSSLPDGGASTPVGTLTDFATNDPAFSCLTLGAILTVGRLVGTPGVYVVSAATPADCVAGTWTFTVGGSTAPGGGSGPGGGGGSGGGPGTTTSTDPTTTTTTTDPTTTTSTTAPFSG
ncbi:MAG: glycosyl hydrolase family 18 protein, partial [Acidimicrobiales bacterium]